MHSKAELSRLPLIVTLFVLLTITKDSLLLSCQSYLGPFFKICNASGQLHKFDLCRYAGPSCKRKNMRFGKGWSDKKSTKNETVVYWRKCESEGFAFWIVFPKSFNWFQCCTYYIFRIITLHEIKTSHFFPPLVSVVDQV